MYVGPLVDPIRVRTVPWFELGAACAIAAAVVGNEPRTSEPAPKPVVVQPDGSYMPFEDMLDSVAPCERRTDRDFEGWEGELQRRFWIGHGCVAGGHDDIDGDGHLDCWTAQYDGGSGSGSGRFSVQRRCRGDAIVATWSWGRYDRGEQLELPDDASESLTRGVARWLFGAPLATDSPEVHWQLDEEIQRPAWLQRTVGGLSFRARHTYAPDWQPGTRPTSLPARTIVVNSHYVIAVEARNTRGLQQQCGPWDIYAGDGALAIVDRVHARWSWAYFDGFATQTLLDDPPICAGNLIVFIEGRDGIHRIGVIDPARASWTISEPQKRTFVGDAELWADEGEVPLAELAHVLD